MRTVDRSVSSISVFPTMAFYLPDYLCEKSSWFIGEMNACCVAKVSISKKEGVSGSRASIVEDSITVAFPKLSFF
jgi:hypothetical protein